ncbi:hypothetical protein ACJMK2_042142, partial [Sinanodonta woodiana]
LACRIPSGRSWEFLAVSFAVFDNLRHAKEEREDRFPLFYYTTPNAQKDVYWMDPELGQ